MEEEWVRVKDAAEMLGVSRATLYRWSQEGIISIYRLGKGIARVKKADVDKLIDDMKPIHEKGGE